MIPSAARRRIAFVTDVPFWRSATGAHARIRALAGFLAARHEVHALFLGPEAWLPAPGATGLPGITLHHAPADLNDRASWDAIRLRLAAIAPDVGIVEYVNLWVTRYFFPERCRVLLDTLDIQSARARAFTAFGYEAPISIDAEEEFRIFREFDRVVMIQEDDRDMAAAALGAGKCLLALHPAPFHAALPAEASVPAGHRFGFFGSGARPNVDGLLWLHERLAGLDLLAGGRRMDVAVFGMVTQVDAVRAACPSFTFAGVVAEERQFYGAVDVVLNPVRFGGGLKIKTVEALGCGKAIVTTPEGIAGLPRADVAFCRVSDAGDDFCRAMQELDGDAALRRELGRAAQDYARTHLTPERCFAALVDYIDALPA